jgi:hypothetical protein
MFLAFITAITFGLGELSLSLISLILTNTNLLGKFSAPFVDDNGTFQTYFSIIKALGDFSHIMSPATHRPDF